MSTTSDPRYQALALLAGQELGATSPAALRAILAQWSCEVGGGAPWPVPRNNPGNISKCGVQPGITYTVAPNAPNGSRCPIVTFADPQTGAHAYAAYLLARMPGAVAYLRAGNGLAFVQTVAAGGYGTSSTCMTSVFRSTTGVAINPGVIPASYPGGGYSGGGGFGGGGAGGSTSGLSSDADAGRALAEKYLTTYVKPYIGTSTTWGQAVTKAPGGGFFDSGLPADTGGEILAIANGAGANTSGPITQKDYDATWAWLEKYGDSKLGAEKTGSGGADPFGINAALGSFEGFATHVGQGLLVGVTLLMGAWLLLSGDAPVVATRLVRGRL